MVLVKKIRFYISKLFNNTLPSYGLIGKNVEINFSKKSKVIIGNGCHIDSNSTICSRNNSVLQIGKNFFMNKNSIMICRKKIKIGDNVLIGPNVSIFDNDHNYCSYNRKEDFICEDIDIGNNVWIGANCVILKGSKIGDNSVIGANTLIKGEILPNTVVYEKRNYITKKIRSEFL